MKAWWRRFLGGDLKEELESHLEMRSEWNRRAGMNPDDARTAARRQFGNQTLIEEEVRNVRAGVLIASLIEDLRYALRGFARSPMFTITAVFAAALGIGASTAVFSVVDRILFRSLPYPHDERLVSLGMLAPADTNEFLFPDAYFDWRKHQTPFDSITSFIAGVTPCDLTEQNPVRLGCASVEGNFVTTLGMAPIIGRSFTEDEDRPNGPNVALITCGLWQSRYGRDPNIAGRTISIDDRSITIVGVLPPNFEMPTLASADLLIPERLNEATERNGRALRLFARLKPGVGIEQARAAMLPIFQQTLQYVPAGFRKEAHLQIRSLRDRQVQDSRTASWVLLAAVAAVLLIACANIANLLLARSMNRRRELAVRSALGASRARLIRQSLTESGLLGVFGGSLGCVLAWMLLRLFVGIAPSGIPRLDQAALDMRVLLYTFLGSLLSGLLFGLAPALTKPDAEALTGARTAGSRRILLRESLVAAQIAVSLLLLTGAGMLLHSLWNLQSIPLGFQAEQIVTAEFTLAKSRYTDPHRQLHFFTDLEAHLTQIPGVSAFAISDSLPPYGGTRARPLAAIQIEGQPPSQEGTGGMIAWRYITPGYFSTLHIPIVQGRGFQNEDRSPGETAVVLSETLARKMFPNGNAIGRRIHTDNWATVIGIAANVRNLGPLQPAYPEYYLVRKQFADETFRNQMPPAGWRDGKVAIRSSFDSKTMGDWIKREIAAVDPSLPVRLGTMRDRVSRVADRARFNALLLGIFAGMGVLLAAVGLYGVMAFLVGQRTQEIGVRMALGATPRAIARLVLSRAAIWTLGGIAVGLVGSFFAARTLRSLLFQVPERDPWTFAVALPLLAAISFAAAWIPSIRASRIDPLVALRND